MPDGDPESLEQRVPGHRTRARRRRLLRDLHPAAEHQQAPTSVQEPFQAGELRRWEGIRRAGEHQRDDVRRRLGRVPQAHRPNIVGLGKLLLRAIGESDLPIVMGVVVFATFAIIIFNLLIDLLYAWIDPRIRLS